MTYNFLAGTTVGSLEEADAYERWADHLEAEAAGHRHKAKMIRDPEYARSMREVYAEAYRKACLVISGQFGVGA